MNVHTYKVFIWVGCPINRFFFPLIILRLLQDKTITGLAVQRNRIPIMAQDHRLLGWFSHLFPFYYNAKCYLDFSHLVMLH